MEKERENKKLDTGQPLCARDDVRACYSAKTNDRNVIIGAVAATCNERGDVENIPKTKRKGLMRQAEKGDTGGKENKDRWREMEREKERDRGRPLSASSNVVAMRAMRHVGIVYTVAGVCAELAYRLSRNQSSSTPCMDRELHVCGSLDSSFSFRGNAVEWRREIREIYCFKNGISRNIMLQKSTPLV